MDASNPWGLVKTKVFTLFLELSYLEANGHKYDSKISDA